MRKEVREKVLHYNEQAFNDQASLRYLANRYPGILFRNEEGLLDVSFEVGRKKGKISRVQIKRYQEDRFLAQVVTMREIENVRMDNEIAPCQGGEVFDTAEEAEEWLREEKFGDDSDISIEFWDEMIQEVNISEVEA